MKNIVMILIALLIVIGVATALFHLLPLILLVALVFWIYKNLSDRNSYSKTEKSNVNREKTTEAGFNQAENSTSSDKNVVDVDYEEI